MPALSGPPRRVGHKGADRIAPGNTRASFDAALAAGVDMIEFDVLSERADGSGSLWLAHDHGDLHARVLSLSEGLDHLAGEAFSGIELDVDLKLPGYELRVLDALREHDLVGRALVSSMFPTSLDVLGAAEPALRLGWSVPRVRRDFTAHPMSKLPALAALEGYRRWLPGRARREVSRGRFHAIMAHWRLASAELVRAVSEAGGEVYAWTVDDPRRIGALTRLGVHGIITNDPRLFSSGSIATE